MSENRGAGGFAPYAQDGFMRRTRIEKLLEKAMQKPIITVIAGSGCGKTSAVYSYLQFSGARVFWHQFTESDNQPALFWEKFINMIALLHPPLAEKIQDMAFPGGERGFNIFWELAGDEIRPRTQYAFVFDDVHLIDEYSVRWFIRTLSERLCVMDHGRKRPNCTLILISRESCCLDTSRLRSEGKLAAIDEADLSFTKNETLELFRSVGVSIDSGLRESIDQIYEQTGGWAFVTAIAGRLLQTRPDGRKYIATALRHNVYMVIENELFAINSDEMNRFLYKLSLFDQMPAELTAMLKNGDVLIKEAMRLSSFLRYDSYSDVYRIHNFLRDFMLKKPYLLSGEERRELYLLAARWHREHEYIMDAAAYFAKAGDYESIIEIIFSIPQIIPAENAGFLLSLLESFTDDSGEIPSRMTVPRAKLLINLGRLEQAIRELTRVTESVCNAQASREDSKALLGAYYMLGVAHYFSCIETGNYDFAQYFKKADAYLDASGFTPYGAMRITTLAPYIIGIGKPDRGGPKKFICAIGEMAPYTSRIMDGYMSGMEELAQCELAYYQCDMELCRQYAITSQYMAHKNKQHEIENRALFYEIRASLAAGKYPPIKTAIEKIEKQLGEKAFINRFIRYDIQTGWFYGSIGHKENIADWLKTDAGGADTVLSSYEDFARCKYYIMEKKYHDALALVSGQEGRSDIGRYLFGKIAFAAYKAVSMYNLRDQAGALVELERAYKLAEPNSLYMVFVELGNNMRTLLAAALKAPGLDIPRPWMEKIQSKSSTYAKRVAQVRSRYLASEGLSGNVSLTQRELEILTDLSHGLSRAEIAVERELSINTVKMTLQYIYEKLGAENSIDAVRIAFTKSLL